MTGSEALSTAAPTPSSGCTSALQGERRHGRDLPVCPRARRGRRGGRDHPVGTWARPRRAGCLLCCPTRDRCWTPVMVRVTTDGKPQPQVHPRSPSPRSSPAQAGALTRSGINSSRHWIPNAPVFVSKTFRCHPMPPALGVAQCMPFRGPVSGNSPKVMSTATHHPPSRQWVQGGCSKSPRWPRR